MSKMIDYSFIIPVYNRPEEVKELLETFPADRSDHYEIILIEDGSKNTCESLVDVFSNLPIIYHFQENQGPGPARNNGADKANGNWLIFLDSDTLLPEGYLEAIDQYLSGHEVDYFGGPDATKSDFSTIQKAIGYSMIAFLSTGGIRGSSRSMERFKPRSFNMGIRKAAFNQVGGFSGLRFGEDIDLSLKLEEAGFKSGLIEAAFVYHKRRSTFRQFYKQVFNSGMARIVLSHLHPGTLKLVHLLPLSFIFYHVALMVLGCFSTDMLYLLLIYPGLFLLSSLATNRSISVAIFSVIAVYVQLFGYGMGMLSAGWSRFILRKPISYAFKNNFYEG